MEICNVKHNVSRSYNFYNTYNFAFIQCCLLQQDYNKFTDLYIKEYLIQREQEYL